MFSNEDFETQFQGAVDTLDVKYIDGTAYMSVHTVDIINSSMLDAIDTIMQTGESIGQELIHPQMLNGAVWVMSVWKQVHDELDLRSEVQEMPDTVPTDLLDNDSPKE